MNVIKISELNQLDPIVSDQLCLSGVQSEEIYHNMWCIVLESDLIKQVKIEQLKDFVDRLVENREQQVRRIDIHKNVVLYMWFDQQALQLRFNIITGDEKTLPFGCKVQLVNVVDPILNNFVNIVREVAQHGDQVQFFDKNGVDNWDEDDEEEYVLDVFVKKLSA